jgi:hypothetical protein
VSPIARLVRAAAASDPYMAALLRASNDTRQERARHHARFLKKRGLEITAARRAFFLIITITQRDGT